MMTFTSSMTVLVIGRIFAGLAIGITSMNAPLYISEVCPTEIRGRVIAIYTFSVVFGQFLANILALMLVEIKFGWRLLVSVSVIIALIQLVGTIFLPESPRWLANN